MVVAIRSSVIWNARATKPLDTPPQNPIELYPNTGSRVPLFLSGGVGCRDSSTSFFVGLHFFALVIDGFGGMCILAEI